MSLTLPAHRPHLSQSEHEVAAILATELSGCASFHPTGTHVLYHYAQSAFCPIPPRRDIVLAPIVYIVID